ncbi:MAG: DUF4336 domain-containing protein [Microcystaceae cyanobacterium]
MVSAKELSWSFWPLLPIYPYGKRQTLRREVIKDQIWTFDQLQGIFYVVVPIRMTVVKLAAGGLLVYAPVAPTFQCIQLMRELEALHGEVKYIILPTLSGLEHKVFVGPFSRRFKQAQVYILPNQWSFPLNLPVSWLGFPGKRTQILPPNSQDTPFKDEFDYNILKTIPLGAGSFAEVAFFHKRSQTLLLTDTIISIPQDPPAIIQLDPYPLLFHAKDKVSEAIENNLLNRRKGWQRIVLFALYFRPSSLDVIPWSQTFRQAFKAVDRSKKGYFGLFPFLWQQDWQSSFNALQNDGKLLVAPILQTLILNRDPQGVLNWVNQVSNWDFKRIIPSHFSSPLKATPDDFKQAFAFLEDTPYVDRGIFSPLPERDFVTLRKIDRVLCERGITPSSKID